MVPVFISRQWKALQAIGRSSEIGVIYAIISTVLLAFAHFSAQLVIKSTTTQKLQMQVVFARCVFQALMLLPFLLLKNSKILYQRSMWFDILVVTLSGYGCYILLYNILQLIPLSIALSISATCPFWAKALAVCVLKEKWILLEILIGLLGFAGVVVIARPTFLFGKYGKVEKVFFESMSESQYKLIYTGGCGLALLFAFSRAVYIVIGRKIAKQAKPGEAMDAFVKVLYPSVLGIMVSPAIMMFRGRRFVIPEETYATCSMVSVGIYGAFGLLFLMLAVNTQGPMLVGVIRNLEIVWSFALQYFILGIVPQWFDIGGSLTIILSTILFLFKDAIERRLSPCCRQEDAEIAANDKLINDE